MYLLFLQLTFPLRLAGLRLFWCGSRSHSLRLWLEGALSLRWVFAPAPTWSVLMGTSSTCWAQPVLTSSTWRSSTHANPPRVRSRRGSGHDGVWFLFARVRGGTAGKGGHQCNLASNACAMTGTCLLHLWWWLHSGTWHACFFLSASQPKNPPLCSGACWRDCSSCGVSLPLPGFLPASLGSTAPRVPSSLCSRCWTHRWFSRQVLSSFACLVQLAGCDPSSRPPSTRLWRGLLGIHLRCWPPTLVPARIAPSRDRRQKRSLRVA